MGTIIALLFDGINSLSVNMLQTAGPLTSSLSDGIPAVYALAEQAHRIVLPVGYTILALFFLLELVRCSTKVESAGGGASMGVQMIFGVLVKLALCKLVMDNTAVLMGGIFDGMNYLTRQLATVCSVTVDPTLLQLPLGSAELLILNLTIVGGVPYLILGLVVLLLVAFVWLRSRLMIYLRFIEAYLYLIVAPVPLATLPGEEWSQIGKSFLKSFAAVAIQGTLLYLTLSFYPVLVSALVQNVVNLGDTIISALLQEAFYALLLLFALSGTTRLADKICNSM